MKDTVVVVSTHDESYAKYFDLSCDKYGVKPVVLGAGQKFESFGSKIGLIKDYIMQQDDEDNILLLDRYDIIVQRPLDSLFRKFDEYSKIKETVYISNRLPSGWKIDKWIGSMRYGLYKNKYMLNTGSWMAKAKTLKKMYRDIDQYDVEDDQEFVTRYLNDHIDDIHVEIDNNRRFLLFCDKRVEIGARMTLIDQQFHFTYNGVTTVPYLIHRNGHGRMEEILYDLGYPLDLVIPSRHIYRVWNHHIPKILSVMYQNGSRHVSNILNK